MAVLADYAEFAGRHYETGSVRNVLAYHGVRAPHTGEPPSEAFLLGLSGGIAFGYFLFDYGRASGGTSDGASGGPGRLLSLLSRNTFDPLETLLDRLAVVREVRQTTDPGRAEATLLAALDAGEPAIVWADVSQLPYACEPRNDNWWSVLSIVVYGLEDGRASIADRSSRPLHVDRADLARARGRIGKERHRLVTLGAPDTDRWPDAVRDGIRQSVALFLDPPPKGARTNFGLAGLQHWAEMLTNTRNPRGWARFFPPGPGLWSALAGNGFNPGLVGWIATWGLGDGMERGAYADFLDEAAGILGRPELREPAERLRASRMLWLELLDAATPDEVPPLREARELAVRRHALFVEEGEAAVGEIRAIEERRKALAAEATGAFPMDDAAIASMRERMSEIVTRIARVEGDAFTMLRAIVG